MAAILFWEVNQITDDILRKYNYLMLYKSAQIMLISQENDTNYILVFFNALGNFVYSKHREHVCICKKFMFVYSLCVDWLNTCFSFFVCPHLGLVLIT